MARKRRTLHLLAPNVLYCASGENPSPSPQRVPHRAVPWSKLFQAYTLCTRMLRPPPFASNVLHWASGEDPRPSPRRMPHKAVHWSMIPQAYTLCTRMLQHPSPSPQRMRHKAVHWSNTAQAYTQCSSCGSPPRLGLHRRQAELTRVGPQWVPR